MLQMSTCKISIPNHRMSALILGLNYVHPAFIMGWMDCTDELTTPGHFAEREGWRLDKANQPPSSTPSFLAYITSPAPKQNERRQCGDMTHH